MMLRVGEEVRPTCIVSYGLSDQYGADHHS